jgi:hypothetical protein
MVSESQKASLMLGATATLGAYAQSTGIVAGAVNSLGLSKLGISTQITNIAIGLIFVGAGFYFDGEWGDYLIAFGTGYALSSVL